MWPEPPFPNAIVDGATQFNADHNARLLLIAVFVFQAGAALFYLRSRFARQLSGLAPNPLAHSLLLPAGGLLIGLSMPPLRPYLEWHDTHVAALLTLTIIGLAALHTAWQYGRLGTLRALLRLEAEALLGWAAFPVGWQLGLHRLWDDLYFIGIVGLPFTAVLVAVAFAVSRTQYRRTGRTVSSAPGE
jgi:hypothetical protein